MKVELIDYTGAGSDNPLYAAKLLVYAKSTRLEQSPETRAKIDAMSEEELYKELEYISNTIRSSWEFIDYKFQISDVTRAFTHQLVRTRYGVSFAQQSQRSIDMEGFETLVPETVVKVDGGMAWNRLMSHIATVYRMYKGRDVPNQDCRGVLPTNVLTNIFMKIDLRALADMTGKRENLRAQGEYADVVGHMKELVLGIHPWAKFFLAPERIATPALDKILRMALMRDGVMRAPADVPSVNDALKELDKLKGIWG